MRRREREELFRELFKSQFPRVYAFFRRQGFSVPEAEELTQDTFLRVYRYVSTIREGDRRAFVMTIARSVWKNELRWRGAVKRPKQTPVGELPLDAKQTSPWTETLPKTPEEQALEREEAAARQERIRQVRFALEDLPPRMRQCQMLRLQGQKDRQIAVAMNSSVEAVKTLLYEGRKRLRKQLGPEAVGVLDRKSEVDDNEEGK